MRNRHPVRLVAVDRNTPKPLGYIAPPPGAAGQPVTAVELAAAGDRLAKAAMAVARAVESREYDHVGADACPLLAELLEARRKWVRACTRWEQHA